MSDGALIVGLGGNVGSEAELRARFDAAVAALADRLSVSGPPRRAALYRSAPVGPVADQPAFLNSAAAFDLADELAPTEIMTALLDIEATWGRDRRRERVQGPRTLDLDALAWGDRCLDDPGPPPIAVPHPRLAARRFALEPLRDLVGPHWRIPGVGSTVEECLARVAEQRVRPL